MPCILIYRYDFLQIAMHNLKYHYFPTHGKLIKFKQRKLSTYLPGGTVIGIGMLHVVIGDVRP